MMMNHPKFCVSGFKAFVLYLVIGLCLDTLLASFLAFCDILRILNLSLAHIFDLDFSLACGIFLLYFSFFILSGLIITIVLYLAGFAFGEGRRLKQFIWKKIDLALILWVLLLYKFFLSPLIWKFLHFPLQFHEEIPMLFGFAFIALSFICIYSQTRLLTISLYVFRFVIIFMAMAVFIHLTAANLSFPSRAGGRRAPSLETDTSKGSKDLNVLLITLDTCRADKLSCYGFRENTSPNIDRLAERGFIFENAFSASNWTRPATASLLTSVYPATHQTYTLAQKIPAALWYLPERFKAGGYETAVFSANPNVSPDFGFDQGVDHFFKISKKA